MNKRPVALLLGMTLILAATGCRATNPPATETITAVPTTEPAQTTQTATGESTTGAATEPGSRCVTAEAAARAIAERLRPEATYTGVNGAVKSEDFDSIYMVGLQITIAGDQEEAVFAVDSLETPANITPLNRFAQEYSEWPAPGADAEVTFDNDGASEALTCAQD
jgi:hypothetical protein